MRKTIPMFSFVLAMGLCAWPHGAHAEDARAKRAYRAKCASCHGEDGKGQTKQALEKFGGLRDLTSPEVQKEFDDAKLKEMITKGSTRMKDGKELKMPATPEITGDQLDGLVRYVRGLAAGK